MTEAVGQLFKPRSKMGKMKVPSKRNCDIHHAVRIEGRKAVDVGKTFGLSTSQIKSIVRQVENWAASMTEEQAQKLVRLSLLRQNHVYEESMRAYRLSQQPEVRRKKHQKLDGDGNVRWLTEETTIERGEGNPAHLRNAMGAAAAMTQSAQQAIPANSMTVNIDFSKLTRKELEQLAAADKVIEVHQ